MYELENGICKMATILSGPQGVYTTEELISFPCHGVIKHTKIDHF